MWTSPANVRVQAISCVFLEIYLFRRLQRLPCIRLWPDLSLSTVMHRMREEVRNTEPKTFLKLVHEIPTNIGKIYWSKGEKIPLSFDARKSPFTCNCSMGCKIFKMTWLYFVKNETKYVEFFQIFLKFKILFWKWNHCQLWGFWELLGKVMSKMCCNMRKMARRGCKKASTMGRTLKNTFFITFFKPQKSKNLVLPAIICPRTHWRPLKVKEWWPSYVKKEEERKSSVER